jgi:chromosome partition protein MukF
LQLHGEYLGEDVFCDERLIDTFEQACELVVPGAENPRKRATHAIERLVEQRMLVRIDGPGILCISAICAFLTAE